MGQDKVAIRRNVLGMVLAGLIALFGGGTAPGQQPSEREKTLQEILKRLDELKAQVEALSRASGQAADSRPSGTLPAEWVKSLKWRPIGPANMGGRISAISVYEPDPSIYWIATASGGLLKTQNNGVTFEHQFDREETVSIGDVCVAPSDPNIVWVGTGENNPRNSVSYGNGVYKSTDGGKTWTHMGLRDSHQTGRIVVHPKDPNTVYVGAMGRLYGPNAERGLFKTTNGGETWEKVLFVDEKTGVIDIAMHPTEPDTMIVATWERMRDGFDSFPGSPEIPEGYTMYDPSVKWGPGSGLHKTTDGGKTWKKLTSGLPTTLLGRMDVDYFQKDPNLVFAVIDCEGLGKGTPPSRLYFGLAGRDAEKSKGILVTSITEDGPASKAGVKNEDVIEKIDGQPVPKFDQFVKIPRSKKVGDAAVFTITREGKPQELTLTLEERGYGVPADGGRTYSSVAFLGASHEDVEGGGVKVKRVFDESNAEKAGLADGDILVELEGKPLADSKMLEKRLRGGKLGEQIPILVKRADKMESITLTLLPLEGGTLTRPYFDFLGGQDADLQDQQGPNGHEYGGVYKSTDGGETWSRINSLNPRPMYFSQIRVDPNDANYLFVLGIDLHRSKDGGKTFQADGATRVHSDHHAMWIDPRDGRHMILGSDGGVWSTYDRGDHWEHLNQSAIAQFYHVAVDTREPYRVYGGLQDNGSWGGPSRSLHGTGPVEADWVTISFGDGFVCRVDPTDPDVVYSESQDGTIYRQNLHTGDRGFIQPERKPGVDYYFNWNTPFILSSHNPSIIYTAGNYVFRSIKRGEDLKVLSPPIGRTGRGTGTALGESPRDENVLWVGTDDGNLFVTRDGGANWTNVIEKVGLPGPRWVATVEPSRFEAGRCYVAFDGHRSDDDQPYLYVTEDYGQTWKSITGDLPRGSTRCLREDLKNPDLLLCGTEFAVWASIDRGESWTKLNNNLPTVAVHELAMHPTAGEVVAATHGRSLWILDLTPLRSIKPETVKADVSLCEPAPVTRWRSEPGRDNFGFTGSQLFVGENPSNDAQIFYSLGKKPEKIGLKIVDYTGTVVREISPPAEPGLNQASWDLRQVPNVSKENGKDGQGTSNVTDSSGPAPAGRYKVVLTVDGKEYSAGIEVRKDPTLPENAPIPERATRQEFKERERGGIPAEERPR